MLDQFTDITTTGYGDRIVNSTKGVVVGLILFLVSFGLLYWNEGQVDLSNIAKTATEISSATISADPAVSGKLISTTGNVNSYQIIGDNLFLNPDKFIAAEREVEMYSWMEKSESRSKTNTGGSETTETTYTYSNKVTVAIIGAYRKKIRKPPQKRGQNAKKPSQSKLGASSIV